MITLDTAAMATGYLIWSAVLVMGIWMLAGMLVEWRTQRRAQKPDPQIIRFRPRRSA